MNVNPNVKIFLVVDHSVFLFMENCSITGKLNVNAVINFARMHAHDKG